MIEQEVEFLSKLADQYYRQGEADPSSNWSDLLKAHTLYNACDSRQPDPRWSHAAYMVQKTYWQGRVDMTFERQQELTRDFKSSLTTIREECRTDLEPFIDLIVQWRCDSDSIDSDHNRDINNKFCKGAKIVSSVANAKMKVFAGVLMEKAVIICKLKPPCRFSSVAMGSLAKGEATPYSDLEFMLLVEHKSSSSLAYFELLSMTVYFLIGNLQETKLKYMNIKELKDFNDKGMNGFKIDGLQPKAGNIPTGNGTPDQRNKFILTVEELINKYREVLDNPDPQESLKGDITAMLAHTAVIHGDPNLLREFENAREGMALNSKRTKASKAMLLQDINDYDFTPNANLGDMFYKVNLKSALYRFPSIVIHDLKLVYGIESSDSWQTLERLYNKNIISQSIYDSLELLLATAQYSRLSAYLFHNSQNEAVTFLQKSEAAQSVRGSSGLWHMPYPLVFHMSLHIIGVKEAIAERGVDRAFVERTNLLTNNKDNKLAKLHCILENYIEAIEILESQENLSLQNMEILATCYSRSQQFDKEDQLLGPYAEQYLLQQQEQRSRKTPRQADHERSKDEHDQNLLYSKIYMMRGESHMIRHEWAETENNFDKSWNMWHRKHDRSTSEDQKYKAGFYYNMGYVFQGRKMYIKARDWTEKSIRLYGEMYGSDSRSYYLGLCYNQMANILKLLHDSEKAIVYYKLAIPCLDYPDNTTGMIYYNIGMLLEDLERYKEAEENLLHAQQVVSTKSPTKHLDLGDIKERLGYVLMHQDKKDEALLYFKAGADVLDVSNIPHAPGACVNRASELIQEKLNKSCNIFYTVLEAMINELYSKRELNASRGLPTTLGPGDYSLAKGFMTQRECGDSDKALTLTLIFLATTIKNIKKWCMNNIAIKRIINPECPMPVYEFAANNGVMFFL